MSTFNQWAIDNLGQWVTEFAALFLVVAVALLLVIIIMLFCIVGAAARRKKKARLAAEKATDTPTSAASVSDAQLAELEAQIRAELEQEYAANVPDSVDADGDTAELIAKNNELSAELEQKNAQIARLNTELENAASDAPSNGAATAELYAQIDELEQANNTLKAELARLRAENSELANRTESASAETAEPELRAQIDELERTVKDKDSEINLLKAENAQIKAQALQQQLAAQQKRDKPEPDNKDSQSPDVEDEYDEYYDDYGDESSAVKVTLKFDRVKNSWIILRSDTDRTYRRLATKQDALLVAKDLARRLHAQLVVHKKDGKFQKI